MLGHDTHARYTRVPFESAWTSPVCLHLASVACSRQHLNIPRLLRLKSSLEYNSLFNVR
jgi:hypothetical protein